MDSGDEQRMRANQANWDARTPIHAESRFYQRDPETWFAEWEWADLGDLTGRDVLTLQCHLGTDVVAFARRGARSVGLDLSGAAIEEARARALRSGDDVEFVQANVYDAVEALGGRRFDVVYTAKGSLCYLPDLPAWASVVAALLRPGGLAYVVDFHPLFNALGPRQHADDGPDLLLRNDYLEGRGAIEKNSTHTYTDGPALAGSTWAYEWRHGIGALVTALAGAGLRVEGLRETEELQWPRWPNMVQVEPGWWRLPEDEPRIPLLFALRATRS
ncbi:class I SAM-dependent methyltransferase [Allokutzneria albata]|uniref:Methyltransferase domain-containing protein n=1 Tax=Allokutzneria albata TaxID=211114 RepID=A0A1G9ZVF6_ALLAB|nr:class I SAM-dependent methyltransferase [Allokutzneria albata]SDN25067.1 Methyltransferase domain-containing protein [Allokutzneria albata]